MTDTHHIRNAYKRAKASSEGDAVILALGIESGLHWTEVDGRAYDVCVCSTYDGVAFNQGLSCAFEIPPSVLKFVVEKGMDLAQATNAAGLSSNPKLGEAEGLIGVLSRGRVTRLDYTKQAIDMALMFIENAGMYVRPENPPSFKDASFEDSHGSALATPLRSLMRTKGGSPPRRCPSFQEVKEEEKMRRDCFTRLSSASREKCGTPFELSLVSLMAAFGEPGDPETGMKGAMHDIDAEGRHIIVVQGSTALQACLGDSPISAALETLTLVHDGKGMAEMSMERAKGQSDLASTWGNGAKPTAQSLIAAAAAEAAIRSQEDPFVVESDGEEEGVPAKRLRTEGTGGNATLQNCKT
eukprot:TRINITY_DN1938_c1_g1_i1.p1 TRINITY_DN1938_c1_g1~~TRINITY_DN1938_c1_g1_i1.p1  ORF type:complete len:355 (-),score=79.93 TRINITY_DN1938_c1_g1_i1:44-1108(-)